MSLYDISPVQWQHRILSWPNEMIGIQSKVALYFMPELIERFRYEENSVIDNHVRVPQGYLAKVCGCSRSSIIRAMSELVLLEVVTVRTKFIPVDFRPRKACFYALTENTLNGLLVVNGQLNRGRGQKNYLCRACGSTNTYTETYTRHICMNCGVSTDWHITTTKEDDSVDV